MVDRKGQKTRFSHKYKIEYSLNGTSWKMLVDKSKNNRDVPHDYIQLPDAVTARHIRITNLGTVPGEGKFAIIDMRVFGNGLGKASAEVKSASIKAYRQQDARSAVISWDKVTDADGYIYGTV